MGLPSKPQFFTTIVSPALDLLKLRLPKLFVKNHGNRLSKFAYLRVPKGVEWPVELHKVNHDVWLHRGWAQFAHYYSLSPGCFLVFRHDGSSRFRVLIFDNTRLEIDYSRTNNLPQSDAKTGEFQVLGEQGTDRVLQRAKAFQPRNPSFIVHIRNRNLSHNLGPVLPKSHCITYFKENDINTVMNLRINDQTWPIKCRFQMTRKHFVVMGLGWREFVLDNDLQDGDKFVFELTDVATKTYYAHLFRISEENDKPIEIPRRRERVMEKAKACLNDSPGFILRYADLKYPVHIPIGHSKEYLKDDGGDLNAIVIHGEGDRIWTVNYRFEGSYPRLLRGWKELRSDNHLEMDDVCVFKLIGGTLKTYKLTIFRANGW